MFRQCHKTLCKINNASVGQVGDEPKTRAKSGLVPEFMIILYELLMRLQFEAVESCSGGDTVVSGHSDQLFGRAGHLRTLRRAAINIIMNSVRRTTDHLYQVSTRT